MNHLILLRHGQSEWNKRDIFTGWIDIPLSLEGVQEALEAGRKLQNYPIDCIYTSTLIRGIMTAMLVMNVHSSGKVPAIIHSEEGQFQEWFTCHEPGIKDQLVPVVCAWQLNERMYGQLQGKNKQTMRQTYGEEQVQRWRRSFSEAPPAGESLKMTAERSIPYFEQEILPQLEKGKNVLVAAHGNSLRSIVMKLDNLSEEQVLGLEIPTGTLLIYEYAF
jgi:2,3-bisphosphoglycerate-dependent phosphoglycerate mutase